MRHGALGRLVGALLGLLRGCRGLGGHLGLRLLRLGIGLLRRLLLGRLDVLQNVVLRSQLARLDDRLRRDRQAALRRLDQQREFFLLQACRHAARRP